MLTNQDLEAIGLLMDGRFKRELHPMNKQIKIIKEHFKTINGHLKKIDRTLEAYFRFFKTNPQLN